MDNIQFKIHFIVKIISGNAIILGGGIVFYEKWFSHFAVIQSFFNLVIPFGPNVEAMN